MQNTFIKVYSNIDSFKGNSKLFSWMYRIATNEALSFINKKAKHNNVSIDQYRKELTGTLIDDEFFTGDEIALLLQRAIAMLPEKQQLVFNMKYFDNLTYQQISDILEISVGGLKANYHHAVVKIKEFIKMHSSS